MSRLTRGAGVVHNGYGRGTVTATRLGGREVRVSFGTFELWMPAAELAEASPGLRVVGSGEALPQPHPEHRPLEAILRLLQGGAGAAGATEPLPPPATRRETAPRFRPGREGRPVEDATVLESFRLGIVPSSQILQWTVGRDEEVATIRAFLRDAAEGAILIEGAYGAGKSHLIRYLEADAGDQGFAVASGGFDPSEATAAFPKKAWSRLSRGFVARVSGTDLDFRAFWHEVASRPAWRGVLGDHPILGPFLERVEAGRADEDDWDWLEGRSRGDDSRPTLHDYSTCANIYCNLLSATGRAAAEVLGLEGLVVLLDEAEVARSVMYRYQVLRGINFFRGLVLMANDDEALLEEGLKRDEVVTGEATGLLYSGHNPIRYTTGIPTHVKVAFALTPGSLQEEFRRARGSIATLPLDVLPPAMLRDLFGRICDRFQSVSGLGVPPRVRDHLFRLLSTLDRASSTRSFIKAAIEVLDYLRFYPDGSVDRMVLGGDTHLAAGEKR
jgi:hypothetical protein